MTISFPPAKLDELVSGYLKLDDDGDLDSDTDGPVVTVGTVIVVNVSVPPISAGEVTVAESAVVLPEREKLSEAETPTVVAVCVRWPPVSAGEPLGTPPISSQHWVNVGAYKSVVDTVGIAPTVV